MEARQPARPGSPPSLRTSDGKSTGEEGGGGDGGDGDGGGDGGGGGGGGGGDGRISNINCGLRRVPETATVLLGGGVNFADLPEYAQIEFQVMRRKILDKLGW